MILMAIIMILLRNSINNNDDRYQNNGYNEDPPVQKSDHLVSLVWFAWVPHMPAAGAAYFALLPLWRLAA